MTILGGRAGRGTGIVHTKKGDLLGVHRRVRPSGVSECVDCESRVNARVGYIRYIYMEYAVRWGGGAKARAWLMPGARRNAPAGHAEASSASAARVRRISAISPDLVP